MAPHVDQDSGSCSVTTTSKRRKLWMSRPGRGCGRLAGRRAISVASTVVVNAVPLSGGSVEMGGQEQTLIWACAPSCRLCGRVLYRYRSTVLPIDPHGIPGDQLYGTKHERPIFRERQRGG